MTIMILLASALLVFIDQLLKIWVLGNLAGAPSMTLIPGLLQLTYVENRGAAFGILQGRVGILSLITLVVIIGGIVALLMGKFKNKLVMWSVGLIIAGGVGNLIDRVFRTFVVDYLDISPLFHFPVFNFADCCVVIGTGLLMVYLFFFEGKEKDVRPVELSEGNDIE
ncbi:signal peptidase II [Oscillospiraceae bacterium PP1C4]